MPAAWTLQIKTVFFPTLLRTNVKKRSVMILHFFDQNIKNLYCLLNGSQPERYKIIMTLNHFLSHVDTCLNDLNHSVKPNYNLVSLMRSSLKY